MSDIQQRSQHRRSIPGLLLELAMIGIGVFLGASAEQWRDSRHHHELATASLRNFRREISDNRAGVAKNRAYHDSLGASTNKFIDARGDHSLQALFVGVHYHGMQPTDFEHSAWDLALATQALTDIEPRLAFALSQLYTVQASFGTMQNDFLQTVFTPSTFANYQDATGLAWAMGSYLADVNIQEPRLLKLYDRLLPQIDSALGGPPRAEPKVRDSTSSRP